MTDSLLSRALELFVGTPVTPVVSKRELMGAIESSAIVLLPASRDLRNAVISKGYTQLHSFVALPSFDKPYLLFPNEHTARAAAARHIYQPQKWIPRVAKIAWLQAMKMGWKGSLCPKILVASRSTLPLTSMVREITGVAEPFFALSLGRQAAVRKLTIQVMSPSGEVLGYLKIPMTKAASGRVQNEARNLERLWSIPALRPYIPRLLFAGKWCDSYVLFQSALAGKRGPVTFNEVHEAFLHKLRGLRAIDIPVRVFAESVAGKCQSAMQNLGTRWESLAHEVLRRSIRDGEGKTLRCGVMHGDFAPWNTRLREKQLLLFDWESADWESPILWDIFHFQIQAAHFFRKKKCFSIPQYGSSDRLSFMLFLLSSVNRLHEEKNYLAIAHYEKLISAVLNGARPWLELAASAA